MEDCYVPQRSIYDTVRLNEQIDSGSKGSLASRHFAGTLPYSQRTLDMLTLCSNGALSSSSVFDLHGRVAPGDALLHNGNAVCVSGRALPWQALHPPQQGRRRSWRALAPPAPGSGGHSYPWSGTGSLTSEDDSGLCSPTAERGQWVPKIAGMDIDTGTRSLSSTEALPASEDLQTGCSFSSGQEEFPSKCVHDATPTSSYYIVSPGQEVPWENCTPGIACRTAEKNGMGGDYGYVLSGILPQPSPGVHQCLEYNELPTTELLVGLPDQDDSELISVVVTQPEPCPSYDLLPQAVSVEEEAPCVLEGGTLEYDMQDLEDFIRAVEREACLANGGNPMCGSVVEEDIERLLATLSAFPEISLTGFPPPQVP